jgi:hypothetical protein
MNVLSISWIWKKSGLDSLSLEAFDRGETPKHSDIYSRQFLGMKEIKALKLLDYGSRLRCLNNMMVRAILSIDMRKYLVYMEGLFWYYCKTKDGTNLCRVCRGLL